MSKFIIAIAVALGLTFGTISFSALNGITKDAVACQDKGSSKDKGEDKGQEA